MKIKLLSFFTFFLILFLLFFYQCGSYKVIPDVCFNKNILPIFISKCTTSGCHIGGTGRQQGGSDFRTYDGIVSKVTAYHPLLSSVYTKCTGNSPSMPPSPNPPLTSTELEYIKYWIHTGAKNSTDCGGKLCDTTNVSFSGRIQPLFNTWCVGCHNSATAGGGYDLSTYAGVKNSISPSDRLMGSLNQVSGYSAMPSGSGKLSTCDINAVQKWVNSGYQNN